MRSVDPLEPLNQAKPHYNSYSRPQNMTRTIYLLSFAAHLGPRHWAIFVPNADSSTKGKVIHVVGTPFTGFGLEFKRNFDLIKVSRRYEKTALSMVDDEHITDVPGDGTASIDITAHDALEMEAKKVDAPVASSTSLDPSAENCQTWVWMYVNWLVKKGLVDGAALDMLKNAKA